MKAIEQSFPLALLIKLYKVVLSLASLVWPLKWKLLSRTFFSEKKCYSSRRLASPADSQIAAPPPRYSREKHTKWACSQTTFSCGAICYTVRFFNFVLPEQVTLWPHGWNVTVAVFSEQTIQSVPADSARFTVSWVFFWICAGLGPCIEVKIRITLEDRKTRK